MSLKELAEAFIRAVQATEVMRKEKQRRAEEDEERRRLEEEEMRRAIRLRRLVEDRWRREREEAQRETQRLIDKQVEEARRKKLEEYLGYYERHQYLKDGADATRRQWLSMGMDAFQVEASLARFMEFSMKEWPEPYRSKCRYTPEEKLAFTMDPFGSAAWINFLGILGV